MTGAGSVVFVGPGKGQSFRIAADRFLSKQNRASAREGFAVIEYVGAPGETGPPMHRHRSFEEAWFVLDGRVAFKTQRRVVTAKRGAYILVPRRVPHTFSVLGSSPARWLGIFSPGRYVGLVEELGAIVPRHGAPDPAAIAALFEKYDSEIVIDRAPALRPPP